MQLPVNVSEVFKIATDMKEVAETPISVAIYLDDTASGVLVGHVRSAFASAGAHTRVTIEYLDALPQSALEGGKDMAVIVAGESSAAGGAAERFRVSGVPTMVVTDNAQRTEELAKASGHPVPAADVIAPVKLESQLTGELLSRLPFGKGRAQSAASNAADAHEAANAGDKESPSAHVDADAQAGAVALDDEAFKILDARMGKWIIAACKDKDLAFALSFPFVRRPLAMDAITATSMQNGAVGLVPILPGADMPIMTLNQIKMVLQIATAYGQPLDKDRVKEIVAVVAGAFLFRNVARGIAKAIPFAGWLVSGTIGFAATEAMGRAMLEYFEAGGDIVGVASVMQAARDKTMEVTKQAAESPMGKSVIARAKDATGGLLQQ